MNRNKLSLCSLTALAVIASSAAHAEQLVTVPTFEGGITASIGTFYVQPSSDSQSYATTVEGIGTDNLSSTIHNVTPDYEFGIEASLGYIFEDTANGIELNFRNISTNASDSTVTTDHIGSSGFATYDVDATGGFELNSFDLMIAQYMDIGDNMQMRFVGGLAYAEIEQQGSIGYALTDVNGEVPFDLSEFIDQNAKTEFTGWGPRVGIDARYDFGQGFGIVGGGSTAYLLGDMDVTGNAANTPIEGSITTRNTTDDIDSHSVANFRANLGIDYVYFFDNEDRATIGLELGYLVDYYADASVIPVGENDNPTVVPYDLTFSGPYLNLKGVF